MQKIRALKSEKDPKTTSPNRIVFLRPVGPIVVCGCTLLLPDFERHPFQTLIYTII